MYFDSTSGTFKADQTRTVENLVDGETSNMANTLRIKRSTGSSAPTSLANAELAFTEGNETLFIGKGTGGAGGSATSVIKIGGKGGFF